MNGNSLLISYVLNIPGIFSNLFVLPTDLSIMNFMRSRFPLYTAKVRGFHFSVLWLSPLNYIVSLKSIESSLLICSPLLLLNSLRVKESLSFLPPEPGMIPPCLLG
jgi:hypothetical protein